MQDAVGFVAIYLCITLLFVALPVGLIKPHWISALIRRNFSRKKALLIFGSGAVLTGSFVFSLIPTPEIKPPEALYVDPSGNPIDEKLLESTDDAEKNAKKKADSDLSVVAAGSSTQSSAQTQTLGVRTEEIIDVDSVPFTEEHLYSDVLAEGNTTVRQEGVNGEIKKVYRVSYQGNTEIRRDLVSATTTVQPVNRIVVHGTAKLSKPKPDPVLTPAPTPPAPTPTDTCDPAAEICE